MAKPPIPCPPKAHKETTAHKEIFFSAPMLTPAPSGELRVAKVERPR